MSAPAITLHEHSLPGPVVLRVTLERELPGAAYVVRYRAAGEIIERADYEALLAAERTTSLVQIANAVDPEAQYAEGGALLSALDRLEQLDPEIDDSFAARLLAALEGR